MLKRASLLILLCAVAPLATACYPLVRLGPAVEVIELDDADIPRKNLDAVRAMAREWSGLPLTGPPAEGAAPPQSSPSVERTPVLPATPAVPSPVPQTSPQRQSSANGG